MGTRKEISSYSVHCIISVFILTILYSYLLLRKRHTLCYTTLSHSLTPRCRVLPKQLTGLQLVKKILSISRNPKVHYRTHKRPPPVSIIGQPNTVHITTSHLLDINLNIIHPSTSRSPQWSLSFLFPHQDPI